MSKTYKGSFAEITLHDGRKVQYEEVRETFLKHHCVDPRDGVTCVICSDYREVIHGTYEVPEHLRCRLEEM